MFFFSILYTVVVTRPTIKLQSYELKLITCTTIRSFKFSFPHESMINLNPILLQDFKLEQRIELSNLIFVKH